MRGQRERSGFLFSYVSNEERVPASHPLRRIRMLADRGPDRRASHVLRAVCLRSPVVVSAGEEDDIRFKIADPSACVGSIDVGRQSLLDPSLISNRCAIVMIHGLFEGAYINDTNLDGDQLSQGMY